MPRCRLRTYELTINEWACILRRPMRNARTPRHGIKADQRGKWTSSICKLINGQLLFVNQDLHVYQV